jgi:phage-related minor tail protein
MIALAKSAFLLYASEVRQTFEKLGNTFAAVSGIVQRNLSALESEAKRAGDATQKATETSEQVGATARTTGSSRS